MNTKVKYVNKLFRVISQVQMRQLCATYNSKALIGEEDCVIKSCSDEKHTGKEIAVANNLDANDGEYANEIIALIKQKDSLKNTCAINDITAMNASMLQIKSDGNTKRTYTTSDNCQKSSSGRHSYHPDCEFAINQQITAELNAAFAYLSMAAFFGRTEVALKGCHCFFLKLHKEEMEHALGFLNYQNMRGGRVKLCPITSTGCTEWGVQKSLEVGLEMEKLIKEKLVDAYEIAEKRKDLSLMHILSSKYISNQDKSISKFAKLLTRFYNLKGSGGSDSTDLSFDQALIKSCKDDVHRVKS